MKDLSKLTDEEIIEYLKGKRIVVVNEAIQHEEEIIVRSDSKVEPQISGGVIKFLSPSGWRFINLNQIKTVGRKKVA
ncbi:gp81 [Corynebacterium phage P1201]|uniref:Gp81 n=1 Tax=Corynebacterium phage P1201 TaxID=384848 RepID=A7IYE8_9CAUD|nr:gp81 [Corynebacterium phage P1201]ABF57531.1 gp81 [Corynebacterium phage P1201]